METRKEHTRITRQLINLQDQDAELKAMVEKSIALAAKENPDEKKNPFRSLEMFYDYIDFTQTVMPWAYLPEECFQNFVTKTDQSCLYIYYLLDRPLEELEGKLPFRPSVQFLEPVYHWLKDYNNALQAYMDSEDSWKEEYYQNLYKDPTWHLDQGWFEDSSNWHSFNQFFSRKLSDTEKIRPLAGRGDDTVVASPGDSLPQGTWEIDENGYFCSGDVYDEHGVLIKTSAFFSVEDLLGEQGKEFAGEFHGGTLTHTFYNFDDYHRCHAPVSGKVLAAYVIGDPDAVGGITTWDPQRGQYVLESCFAGWQSYETRGCVIIETDRHGLVAVLPVAQGQVSSVHFTENVQVGQRIEKGDELGYFLFGGSDCVMLFSSKTGFSLSAVPASSDDTYANGFAKILCRAEYGRFVERV
jgi:phosphatidylserine decarboxylase